MDAEQIVRALAAAESPDCDSIPPTSCVLCRADEFPPQSGSLNEPTGHAADCPWRLAREWVAAQPA
jgi:hypothetical protein